MMRGVKLRWFMVPGLAVLARLPSMATGSRRPSRADGLCGYRILPGCLLLSRRRKRRCAECRRDWENACLAGSIDARALQARYATAQAITAHADAAAWCREQLRRRPLAQPLADL